MTSLIPSFSFLLLQTMQSFVDIFHFALRNASSHLAFPQGQTDDDGLPLFLEFMFLTLPTS
jgi:hypothetical protein